MQFTELLWRSTESIYAAILAHPFLQGLTDGSLSREAFQFYVIQDAHYLRYFAQSLSIAAAKAPSDDWLLTFNRHAAAAIEGERALHDGFFKEFAMPPSAVWATPLAPTNLAYTQYLVATAYARPFHEGLGALLPCYWIYWEVGKELERHGSPDPLYRRWIDTYAAEAYGAAVRQVLELALDTAGNLYVTEYTNHRIQKFAPGVPGWKQTNINGFGDRRNDFIYTMGVFGNKLYAGTYNNGGNGGELWSSSNGNNWTPVLTNGFGITLNSAIDHILPFSSQLYARADSSLIYGKDQVDLGP